MTKIKIIINNNKNFCGEYLVKKKMIVVNIKKVYDDSNGWKNFVYLFNEVITHEQIHVLINEINGFNDLISLWNRRSTPLTILLNIRMFNELIKQILSVKGEEEIIKKMGY